AVRLAERGQRDGEGELVGGRTGHVHGAVDDGVSVLVRGPGEVLAAGDLEAIGPLREATGAGEVDGCGDGEGDLHAVDGPGERAGDRHLVVDGGVEDGDVDVLDAGEAALLPRMPGDPFDLED